MRRYLNVMINSSKAENNVIGIDIGGTKVKIACIDFKGEILWSKKESVIKDRKLFLKQLFNLISEANQSCPDIKYQGIGIGIPAVIDHDNDTIIQSPNLHFIDGCKLKTQIKSRLKSVKINLPIKLGFDGTASIVAEAWQGYGDSYSNILSIAIGTGIGGGLMLEDKIITGYNNVAGAVGWTVLNIGEKFNNYEEVCSGPAIGKQAKKLYGIQTSKEFFDKASQDRKTYIELLDKIILHTGLTVSNLVSVLNPELVVFTGSVGLRFAPYLDEIQKIIKRYAQPIAAQSIKLSCSNLGNNFGVIGAAGFVII